MPKKTFNWWIKTPGTTVTCPWCDKQMYVMQTHQIKASKTQAVQKRIVTAKKEGDDGSVEMSED